MLFSLKVAETKEAEHCYKKGNASYDIERILKSLSTAYIQLGELGR